MDRVRRPSPGRAAAVGALLIGMLLALGMTPVAAEAATSTSKVQIVLENPDFSTLAVDRQGRSYGVNTNASAAGGKYRLYRSGDEGRTWAPTHDFPASTRIYGLSVLSSGTLLLHLVDTDFYLYRSSDAGQTWTQVLHFPLLYETLTAHSVTDDGAYAYAGSYNVLDSSVHDNWIWRSADDGRTWQIIRTTNTHRHIHAVQVDPSSGALYALYGDSGAQVAIERSNDHGASWQTVCSGTPCVAVDISFDGAGHAIFGQDAPRGGAQIQRLDLADGKTTSVLAIPGASYSALNLNGTFLVGTSREPNGSYPANDPNVHLYGSADGGATFSEYFTIPWQNPNSYVNLLVQHAFPNGDFVIQVDGYGTIVARLAAPGPPPPAPPPSGGGGAPAPPTPPPVAVTPPVVTPPVVFSARSHSARPHSSGSALAADPRHGAKAHTPSARRSNDPAGPAVGIRGRREHGRRCRQAGDNRADGAGSPHRQAAGAANRYQARRHDPVRPCVHDRGGRPCSPPRHREDRVGRSLHGQGGAEGLAAHPRCGLRAPARGDGDDRQDGPPRHLAPRLRAAAEQPRGTPGNAPEPRPEWGRKCRRPHLW